MPDEDTARRPSWIDLVVLVGVSMVGMFILSAIALMLYTNASRAPETIAVQIPVGTSVAISSGQNPLGIPDRWSFQADDTLLLDNGDDVAHFVGALTVEAGTVGDMVMQEGDDGLVASSLVPAGEIDIDVVFRNFKIQLLIYPTIGFGFSIGFILWIGFMVMRSLDYEPDVSEYLKNTDSKS